MSKETKRVRIPLVCDDNAANDWVKAYDNELITNGFVSKGNNEKIKVHRRRGFSLQANLGYGPGQALGQFNGNLWSVNGDRLAYGSGGSPVSSVADGSAWTSHGSAITTYEWTGGAGMITFKDKMWRMGGMQYLSAYHKSTVFSSINGVDWVSASSNPLWGPRAHFGLVEFRGKLWLFGGTDGTASKNDVWSSNDGINWVLETTAAAWSARHGFGCVASHEGIYLVGGSPAALYSGVATYLGDVWFTPDGINWKQLVADADVSPIYRRAYFNMLYFDDKIWIVQGYRTGGLYPNNVAYSHDGKTWTQTTGAAFSTGGCYSGANAVYDNKMWHIGGVGGLTYVYSSADGATWTLTGYTESKYGHNALVWKNYTAPTQSNLSTIWIFCGYNGVNTYAATLNVSVSNVALSVLTAGERFRMAEMDKGALLVLKNLHRIWVFNGNTAKLVTSPNVPKTMVDGLAVLDNYIFVMDQKGVIYNCALNDPYRWNALDYITAEYATDNAVFLTRYLNYIVAMKERTIQFFQDAGNPLGSPLAPMLNATLQIGCASANSVAHIDNAMVWVGRGTGGIGVYMLEGFTPKMISTPQINEQLARYVGYGFKAAAIKSSGHSFYLLSIQVGAGLDWMFVYDMTMGLWYRWNTLTGVARFFDAVEISAGTTYFIAESQYILKMADADNYFTDVYGTYWFIVRTPPYDFGSNRLKRMQRLELIGTQTTTAVGTNVYTSDDDWKSNVLQGTVNMATAQPALWRLGAFRKRAFMLQESDPIGSEWEALECEIS